MKFNLLEQQMGPKRRRTKDDHPVSSAAPQSSGADSGGGQPREQKSKEEKLAKKIARARDATASWLETKFEEWLDGIDEEMEEATEKGLGESDICLPICGHDCDEECQCNVLIEKCADLLLQSKEWLACERRTPPNDHIVHVKWTDVDA